MEKEFITCDKCNAACCRTVAVGIEKPTTKEDWEDIKWQVAHKNIIVYLDNEDDWVVEFEDDCEFIDPKTNKCTIYEKRPKKCREHSMDNCIKNGEGDVFKIMFRNPQDVDDYLANKQLKKKIGHKK